MKTTIAALLFLLLSISSALAQTKTALDFRSYNGHTEDRLSKLSRVIEKEVIAKVVKKTDKACFDKLQPKVIAHASGSFTAPKLKQVVYLVDLGDSCHPRSQGTVRLAIASGKNITTYGDVTGYYNIRQITDINADGINEILLEGSWLGQGYLSGFAKLVSIKPRGILTVSDFKQVYGDNSGATPDPNQVYQLASVISVTLNSQRQPIFKRDNYIAKCTSVDSEIPKCGDFRYMSSGKFPEYDEVKRFLSNLNFEKN